MSSEIAAEASLPDKGTIWSGAGKSSIYQTTMPSFKEGTAVEKPRLKNHTSVLVVNGTGNGVSDHSPPAKLERITEGSIPISRIADRVIRKSYGEFLNLAETYVSFGFPKIS